MGASDDDQFVFLSYREQKPWYDALSEEAKHSRYGKMVKESVAPDSQIGSKVPVFTAKSQDGKSVTLTDLCQGKKYVLIDFLGIMV